VLLVLITGARSATLLQRLPFLPAADAYVCENGGRIFYSGSELPTACPLTEDMEWRKSLTAAGAFPPCTSHALVDPNWSYGYT
jgi:hydroxymethylpyrimidine pyrophosphatase-like HAD family hydrolase